MSIGDLYPAVLAIVMVGVMIGVGLYILSTLHTSIAIDYDGTQGDINTSTGTTTLANAALTEFAIIDTPILIINNATGTAYTNFTCTAAGVCAWGTDIDTLGDDVKFNVSYTYNYDATDTPEESITTSVAGIATFADWIAIIVVVIAAAIVLGVVLSSFGRRQNSI